MCSTALQHPPKPPGPAVLFQAFPHHNGAFGTTAMKEDESPNPPRMRGGAGYAAKLSDNAAANRTMKGLKKKPIKH